MWKILWFWKLLLTYSASMLMVTALGTSPVGIIEFAGIQPAGLPGSNQDLPLSDYYSSDSINAAMYAIVTALLLAVNLIGKDSSPSELLKAAIVDFCNRAAIALAALGTGLYWLASTLQASPLPYLQAFGTISSVVLVVVTLYIILGLFVAYVTFVILRWLYRMLKQPIILAGHWIFGKVRTAMCLTWSTLRRTPRRIQNRTLFAFRWLGRKFRRG